MKPQVGVNRGRSHKTKKRATEGVGGGGATHRLRLPLGLASLVLRALVSLVPCALGSLVPLALVFSVPQALGPLAPQALVK